MNNKLFPFGLNYESETKNPQDEKLFRVFYFIAHKMGEMEEAEASVRLNPLPVRPPMPSTTNPVASILCELYRHHITPEPDETYQKKLCALYQIPFLTLRADEYKWSNMSFQERLDASTLFAASLFAASTDDPDTLDMDGMMVVSTCLSQHPQFDMCHILYCDLLYDHMTIVIQSYTADNIVRGATSDRYKQLLDINENIFTRKTVRMNTFALLCLFFSMHAHMSVRNYSQFPPGNEIMLELPAMASDTAFIAMPEGIPLQITDATTGLYASLLRLVDRIGYGIESAPSEAVERTMRLPEINDILSMETGPLIGSYLFAPDAQLSRDVQWLAYICECVDPAYLIISHDYLFVPRKNRGCPFYIVIVSGTLFGIELPDSRFIRYNDAFDLAVDCAYMIRFPLEVIY